MRTLRTANSTPGPAGEVCNKSLQFNNVEIEPVRSLRRFLLTNRSKHAVSVKYHSNFGLSLDARVNVTEDIDDSPLLMVTYTIVDIL